MAGKNYIRLLIAVAALASSNPSTAQETRFEDSILAAHNAERARVGVPPLVWDEGLARSAAIWSRELALSNRFEHNSQQDEGENLWQGTVDAYTPEEMVSAWVDEKKDFQAGRFPRVSRTGDWLDVGHYTQLIWKNTTHVGCAKATGFGYDILTCRYSPPGNWDGVFVGRDSQTSLK